MKDQFHYTHVQIYVVLWFLFVYISLGPMDTVHTLVSIGPGAIQLNLIPYLPHSAAKDLNINYNI